MSTQRRVVRLERVQGTELAGAVSLTSVDEEGTALNQDFGAKPEKVYPKGIRQAAFFLKKNAVWQPTRWIYSLWIFSSRVIFGLTASTTSPQLRIERVGLATNSLSFSSSCHRRPENGPDETGFVGFASYRRNGATGSWLVLKGLQAGSLAEFRTGFRAGPLPGQLSLDSPLLAGSFTMHSALPQIPMSFGSGTERQHGQGNLYFKHSARNAACDIGR
jgi:hypothetical protein